ncbi:MAG: trypsin-like peptidase domain-containing protein [Nitriliruptorales bacterium]|nr:trypsin-like peptidase domain-containing protein [Nitriliruptorales bacterium]
MAADREEWQRPWRRDDHPTTEAPSTPAASGSRTGIQFVNDPGDGNGQPAQTDTIPVRPASPEPPPSTWGAEHAGPGSPQGSVRPPDTTGTVDPPPVSRSAFRRALPVLIAAVIGAVLGTAGTLALVRTAPAFQAGPATTAPTVEVVDGDFRSVVPAVAQAVTPSVVRIDVLASTPGVAALRGAGVGSGVIYRSDGYILTNNHVVAQGEGVEVKLADGSVLEAEIVGTDPLNDLAVVKVDATGLPAINLRSEPVVVGETAIAIGSPFGLDASVTAGVISAVNRELSVPGDEDGSGGVFIPAVVQTDAAINPGNSGGALVDANGRLIGINTAILSGSGGSQGVGFAIPVEQARATADQLIEQGFVRHPFLGIGGRDLTREEAQRLGTDDGAVIEQVVEDSGAADAGLEEGDVIVALNGQEITDMTDLIVEIRSYEPGDTVTVTVLRGGQEVTVDVELGERPR